jgi:hypothetical protein
MSTPCVVFVFGMGRSGTSAITRVLSLCGAQLPAEILGATQADPKGHWEAMEALRLNKAFLYAHQSNWFDPTLRLQEEDSVVSPQAADEYVDRIRIFLCRSATPSPLLVKEPRIPAVAKYWAKAAGDAGLTAKYVIPVRSPNEVMRSIVSSYNCTEELATLLWIKYNLLAEAFSRLHGRVFVEYSSLLENWRLEVDRVNRELSLQLKPPLDRSVDEFLDKTMYHHRKSPVRPQNQWQSMSEELYDALSSAARSEGAPDPSVFDRARASYRESERIFRLALHEFSIRQED